VRVEVGMPANIWLHGRKEGLRGPWARQASAPGESLAQWTDLGVVAGDCILVQKALQLAAKQALLVGVRAPTHQHQHEQKTESMTELPRGMPAVDLRVTRVEVRLLDDSFEVWMSAFQRLHLDEAAQRLRREQLLDAHLHEMRRLMHVSPAAENKVREELKRQHAALWLQRVKHFKRSDFFDSPPPLMSFDMHSLSALLTPHDARALEPHLARLVSPGAACNLACACCMPSECTSVVACGAWMRMRQMCVGQEAWRCGRCAEVLTWPC